MCGIQMVQQVGSYSSAVKPSQYVSCSLMELHSKFDFGVSLEFNPYPSLLVAEIIK